MRKEGAEKGGRGEEIEGGKHRDTSGRNTLSPSLSPSLSLPIFLSREGERERERLPILGSSSARAAESVARGWDCGGGGEGEGDEMLYGGSARGKEGAAEVSIDSDSAS